MARNEEKHYGKLNRLILQKEKEEYMKKHPKRPRLDVLNTTEEIKEWIPSIKSDMNFYLKQSQVTCYSDQKVVEYRLKVSQLEKEYKAFIRKMKKLNPDDLNDVPWTHRPYKSKNEGVAIQSVTGSKVFTPIATPILESCPLSQENCKNYICDVKLPFNDQPLNFTLCTSRKDVSELCQIVKDSDSLSCSGEYSDCVSCNENCLLVYREQSEKKDPLAKHEIPCESESCGSIAKPPCKTDTIKMQNSIDCLHSGSIKPDSSVSDSGNHCLGTHIADHKDTKSNHTSSRNVLGLDYSSSSDSDYSK